MASVFRKFHSMDSERCSICYGSPAGVDIFHPFFLKIKPVLNLLLTVPIIDQCWCFSKCTYHIDFEECWFQHTGDITYTTFQIIDYLFCNKII